jgi:tripartite-type tricarboxylate transporter receptor subunit TctC
MKTVALIAAAALSLAATTAVAQEYPAKPVRCVVPWPPGGSNDVVARVVMQKMSETMGKQFLVDNRGGAAGVPGADFVAKSPPDGYTIMVHSATHVSNPHLYAKIPYDTLKDFVAVAPLSVQVGMLVVHPALPAKTVKEFIAIAKGKPDQLTYSSSGSGSFVHLSMAMFASMAGIKMTHVPYKGGGPAAISIASGETQAQMGTIGSVIQQVKQNRVRALAVTSEKRVSVFPDLPTIAEAGVPGYEFTAWIGTFAPAATPKPIVDRLNTEINKVLKTKEVAENLRNQTLEPMIMTPDQFAKRVRSDYDKYEKVVKLTGAKVE